MYIYKCVWCTYVAIVSHAQEVEARVMVHPGSMCINLVMNTAVELEEGSAAQSASCKSTKMEAKSCVVFRSR